MKKRKLLAGVLALALSISAFPASALADGYTANPDTTCSSITGNYTFENLMVADASGKGTFAYNDEWFSGSSFDYNPHLATFAAVVADASVSVFKDSKLTDFSQCSRNIRELLEKLELEDVETNAWYDREMRMNTMGVAVGHKTVDFGEGEKTLLFVIPRSAGYNEEWGGNFILGTEGIASGFLEARDEVLRFVKGYVEDKDITGDVIIFTAGYSRGSAISNTLGGFFAAGGAGGYIEGISVGPEDVYSYSFGVPNAVPSTGLTMKQALSVTGARGKADPLYAMDSAGEAYNYSETDANNEIDPHDTDYGGVYYFDMDDDLITMLPPEGLGFTAYGVKKPLTDGSAELKEKMLECLKNLDELNPDMAEKYKKEGDSDKFAYKTLDPKTLSFIEDPSAPKITQKQFMVERLAGISNAAGNSRDSYVNGGTQEVLSAMGGLFGLCQNEMLTLTTWVKAPEDEIRALVFTYLAYGSEKLISEGRAENEEDAASIILADILKYFTGQTVDATKVTVDEVFQMIAKFLVDDVDATFSGETFALMPFKLVDSISYKSAVSKAIFEGISKYMVSAIPAEYDSMIEFAIPGWTDADETKRREMAGKFVFSFLNGCVYGYGDEKTPGADEDAKTVRENMYNMAITLFADKFPEITAAISDATTKSAKKLAGLILNTLKNGDDVTLDEGADMYLVKVLDSLSGTFTAKFKAGSDSAKEVERCIAILKKNPSKLRELLMDFLFYNGNDEFSVASDIRNAATLVGNAKSIMMSHFIEIYISWLRAQDTAYPAHSHKWGAWEVTKKATTVNKGEEERSCEYCGKTETRDIPRIKPTTDDDDDDDDDTQEEEKKDDDKKEPEKQDPKDDSKDKPGEVITKKYSNEWVKGKWYNKNGTQTYKGIGSWKSNKKGKWYQDSLGWYPKNRWQKIDGKWYFFDSEGYMETNAYRKGWYLTKDGSWDGKAAVAGWKKDSKGWWYSLGKGEYLRNTWKKIDGKWYYFKSDGYAARNEFINGWWLSENCMWLDKAFYDWHRDDRGWWYGREGGWYAKGTSYMIDGVNQKFDASGYHYR